MGQEVLVGDEGPFLGWERWETLLGRGGADCCHGGWRGLGGDEGERKRKMRNKYKKINERMETNRGIEGVLWRICVRQRLRRYVDCKVDHDRRY